ncbi:MAG: Ldh family oxidoreductase [Planctomycetes bacterium]|nr:Ldh family oxidoreductase [Planctomycetota bacterium]
MSETHGPARVSPERLEAFVRAALEAIGMGARDAATTAEALALADSMGVHTHGTKLLAGYLKRLKGGGYKATGAPRVSRQGPAWALVDGDSALGQVGGAMAMGLAISKARSVGVAYVGLRNTAHIGAAGYYAWMAAREGLFGLVVGNDIPSVAAPGSTGPVLGSNPLAWAAPVPGGDPILLDMATAAVAGGKVYAAWQRGEPIPPTWLIGPDGHPTTDGNLYPQSAALAPMAGHKGYGLGLLAEWLSGVIPGGAITWQVGSWMFDPADKPSAHNAGFIAMDIASIADPEEYRRGARRLVEEIHAAKSAPGVGRVMLPGEREWDARRKAMAGGIPLPSDVVAKLAEASGMTGVPFPG